MKLRLSTTALAAAFLCASVAHAGPGNTSGGGGGGGPVDPGDPGDEPDYYQDPNAGISGDGSGSTGTGVNAVPTNPTGSTNYTTPKYGSTAGLGGAQQGGFGGGTAAGGQSAGLISVGQVFTAPAGTLNQISFVDTNSASGGEQLQVATFNSAAGFTADGVFANPGSVGPVLYTSTAAGALTNFGDGGGVNGNDALFYHTFSNIGLNLVAGQSYYAYLTPTSGSQVMNGSNSGYGSRAYFFELATNSSSLGGEFLVGTTGGNYARVANQAAGTSPYLQAYYDISITPSAVVAVPELATWAMMIGGFGLAGVALRRRRTSVSFA